MKYILLLTVLLVSFTSVQAKDRKKPKSEEHQAASSECHLRTNEDSCKLVKFSNGWHCYWNSEKKCVATK